MEKILQDVLCVLLQKLLDQKLITQEIHDRTRERILDTSDWPEFFCRAEGDGKEKTNGSA